MKKNYEEPEVFCVNLGGEIMQNVGQGPDTSQFDANESHVEFEDDEMANSTIWDTEESEN